MVLTGREKATIFLSILGSDVSSRVLRYLPDEIADIIAAGINHLPTPSPEALSEVINEYQSFLALAGPEQPAPLPPPPPPAPRKSYTALMYERPQLVAFILSLLDAGEQSDLLTSFPRDRSIISELRDSLRPNVLRSKLEAKLRTTLAGKVF